MSTPTIEPAPIRKTLIVEADVERALQMDPCNCALARTSRLQTRTSCPLRD
jgi:hypothetical protein